MLKARDDRKERDAERRAWNLRQRAVFHDKGRAAVMKEDMFRWLKAIKKARPKAKAVKPFLRLDVYRRHDLYGGMVGVDEKREIFSTITLDFADGYITAHLWAVAEDEGMVLTTFAQRLSCRLDRAFSVRVDFDTLYDVIDWMSPERVDLWLDGDDLRVETAVNRNRLKHVRMNPITAGNWFFFEPAPMRDPDPEVELICRAWNL